MNLTNERLRELRSFLHNNFAFHLSSDQEKAVNDLDRILTALILPEIVDECEREIGKPVERARDCGYYSAGCAELMFWRSC